MHHRAGGVGVEMAKAQNSFSYPPRGIRREAASIYIGVSASKFDEMVADGRMPRPKRVDGCVIWDRIQLDAAFTDLPNEAVKNPLDPDVRVGMGSRRVAAAKSSTIAALGGRI